MDVVPDEIVKLELESSVIKKENMDGLTNIKTERDEDNILSKRIKQELESAGCGNTENESGEIISTGNIKIERDQAIENQINKILGTTIKEEPDLNEELTTDYMVNLECLPNIKTEELMLKNENEDSEGGSYKERCAFSKHRKISIEKYDCHQCDYTSRHKDHLVQHISVTHIKKPVKEYGYGCCNHKANQKDNLSRHILVNNEKKSDSEHVCYLCEYAIYLDKYSVNDYEFVQKEDWKHDILTKHSNSATKNHTCDICNYKTHSKSRLNDHINSKHNKKLKKQHGCDICGYRAHWKRSLRRHMIKHSTNLLEKDN